MKLQIISFLFLTIITSCTVSCTVNVSDSVLMSQALLSPAGEISVFILNKSSEDQLVSLKIENLSGKTLNVYQVTKENVLQPKFELDAIQSFNSTKTEKLVLPARSITTVSSYALTNNESGIILH